MIGVDASVWIDFRNGLSTPEVERRDSLLGVTPVAIGDLILVEVHGVRQTNDGATARQLFRPPAGEEALQSLAHQPGAGVATAASLLAALVHQFVWNPEADSTLGDAGHPMASGSRHQVVLNKTFLRVGRASPRHQSGASPDLRPGMDPLSLILAALAAGAVAAAKDTASAGIKDAYRG